MGGGEKEEVKGGREREGEKKRKGKIEGGRERVRRGREKR